MKILPALCSTLLAISMVHGDVTVTQQLEQEGGKPLTVTMKFKDGMVRSDINQQMTAIIDGKTGDTTTLLHDQKMAMKIPGALVKAAQAQAMGQATGEEAAKPEKTGREEIINGFRCEEYTVRHAGQTVSVWVTRDIPDAAEIMKQFAVLSPESNPAGQLFDATEIEGFPIRTTAQGPGGKQITMTVTGLSREPLPATDFQAPKGYREMAMPQIPGQ